MTWHIITVWLFSATLVSKQPPRPPNAYYPGADKQPPHPPMPRCHIAESNMATKWWTAMMDGQHSNMNINEGPPTNGNKDHHHHPPTATSAQHQHTPVAARTGTMTTRHNDRQQWGCPTMPQCQCWTMTQRWHETRTCSDDMQLGDNNTCKDDDKGPGPPTNGDEAHHRVMSPFPFPLASPFPLFQYFTLPPIVQSDLSDSDRTHWTPLESHQTPMDFCSLLRFFNWKIEIK